MDTEKLKEWFKKGRRDFPWRGSPTPYEVWISEVMLQQTQAVVVIEYFYKWMELFPDIEALAAAPVEQVIKAWEGLGYYSRARNLHLAAQYLVRHHQGKLPDSLSALQQIPGIGPYTAGAILSFAYHKKSAAVDGNVIRVVARFYKIEEDVSKPSTQKKIYAAVVALLPDVEAWTAMEALIELGACVCKKIPQCFACPIREGCQGKDDAGRLPFKGKKTKITALLRHVAVVRFADRVLVRKGDSGKIMADLYEFPYWEETIRIEELGIKASLISTLPKQKASFTRYVAELLPSLWEAEKDVPVEGYQWISMQNLGSLPFSSGHRRILQGLLNAHFTH